jgi:peptide/nickel transport system substrate-binding protein
MEEKKLHPVVHQAQEMLRNGNISRRDFLRLSTLVGMSLTAAELLAACAPAPTAVAPAATSAPAATAAPTDTAAPAATATAAPTQAMEATSAPTATAVPASTVVRGGTLTCATRVERVDNPATFSLVSASHPWRHVIEYLTHTGPDGITKPYLLDSWKASDDLKTWTLNIRKGIKFNNGKELTADDVMYNFKQWLTESVKSSMYGAMSYMDATGVEKTDDYTVTLHLKSPSIFIPEHLAQYPAGIVPATFGGDIIKEPIGTGAFTMEEYVVGERCRLKARKDYWGNGEDGKPLPYLDEIVMVQLGEDRSADLSAYMSGQVDTIIEPNVAIWEALKDDAKTTIVATPTTATRVLRLRVDQDPWTKNEVRTALKHCQNREKILALALQGQGTIGNDSHVGQANPEYVEVAPYPFDPAKSLEMLKAAGITTPLKVELTVASDWPESMAFAQALKEDAVAGGFDITLKPMPASQYWDVWTTCNMGITWWSHRTLAPMTLSVAYTADDKGNPGAWNESGWVDKEFSEILTQATGTLDLAKRKEMVGKLEVIQKERGSILLPFFMSVWKIYTKKVHGVEPTPDEYAIFYETWKEA